jgi:hypothetical protein
MAEEIKRTVTETDQSGVNETGANVQQQTKVVKTDATADSRTTASNAVWYLLGLVEILLGFRFVLKLFGANQNSGFVDFIYSVTGVLTAPFDNIFGVTKATAGETKSVFEPSILVAGVVYALIAWGIVKLFTMNKNQ